MSPRGVGREENEQSMDKPHVARIGEGRESGPSELHKHTNPVAHTTARDGQPCTCGKSVESHQAAPASSSNIKRTIARVTLTLTNSASTTTAAPPSNNAANTASAGATTKRAGDRMAGDQAPRSRELSVVRADDDGRFWSLWQIKHNKLCRWAAGWWLAGPKGTAAPPSNDTVTRLAPNNVPTARRLPVLGSTAEEWGREPLDPAPSGYCTWLVKDCQRLFSSRFSRPFHGETD